MNIFTSREITETEKIARNFANEIKSESLILLYGEPGAGKTAFAGALIGALYEKAGEKPPAVTSPTYTIAQIYQAGVLTISHFDFYRLTSADELEEIGFYEAILSGVTVAEWPQIAEKRVEPPYFRVTITQNPQDREIKIEEVKK